MLLVVAKAPVPGHAKTRLSPPASPVEAAEIAAASLLDTLDAVLTTPDTMPAIAFTGDLDAACREPELHALLMRATVFEQRGEHFGARLARAHADAADRFPGTPVLQVGMDTPQLTPDLLGETVVTLSTVDCVLGLAADGGWWGLGLRDPRTAAVLGGVPMSRSDTGDRTLHALQAQGLRVALLPELSDVDTMDDALAVAGLVPGSRFASAVKSVCS